MSEYRISIKPLRQIFAAYWKDSKFSISFMTLCILAGSVISVAAPYLFSRLIDDLPDTARRWMMAFSLYAVLLAGGMAIQRCTTYLAVISAERLGLIAGTAFFDRVIRKQPSFFVDHNPSEIQSAQRQGASVAAVLMQIVFISLLPGISSFLFTISMLGAAISSDIVVIVLVYGVVFLTLNYLSNRVITPCMDAAIAAGQDNARFVGNAISMIEPLRQSGSVEWMRSRFAESAGSVFTNWRAYSIRRIGFIAVFSVALAVQFIVTFYLLLPRYEQGLLSVGDIVLFNLLLLQLNRPFEMIGHAIDETVRGIARLAPFSRIWIAPEEQDAPGAGKLELARGTIEFENTGFRYPDGRGVEAISFIARRGQITFITGETGSGKSTLFKLLQKTLEPQRGTIRIDGRVLSTIARDDWFRSTGIVPQEVLLLNGSLRENIVLGRPYDEARLRRAAERAAILERIAEMPRGFDTLVGERGLKLSGGERQRIAIARALYSEPSILLLDEASSALDDATEREIMDQLRTVDVDITIIAITHRQSSIHAQDQVIRLEAGQAVPAP